MEMSDGSSPATTVRVIPKRVVVDHSVCVLTLSLVDVSPSVDMVMMLRFSESSLAVVYDLTLRLVVVRSGTL